MPTTLKAAIKRAHEALDVLGSSAATLRYSPQNATQICAVQLFATIATLLAECLALAEAGRGIGVPILFRSMVEATIDLENLLIDPKYFANLEFVAARNSRDLLVASIHNPLFADVRSETVRRDELSFYGRRLKELEREGARELKIEEKFRRVRRDAEYSSFYALFCMDTHNSLAALEDRHATEDGVVSMLLPPHEQTLAMRLDLATRRAVAAGQMMHGAFRTGDRSCDAIAGALKAPVADEGESHE